MEKTILVVLCGKSASGKDSLARYLKTVQPMKPKEYFNLLIGDTTRPPRPFEQETGSYHFISEKEFLQKLRSGRYADPSSFRDWWYGTDMSQLKSSDINLLITSPHGLRELSKPENRNRLNLVILPYYLECPFRVRLQRSKEREDGSYKFEFFRRAFADFRDFRHIKQEIPRLKVLLTGGSKGSSRLSCHADIIAADIEKCKQLWDKEV